MYLFVRALIPECRSKVAYRPRVVVVLRSGMLSLFVLVVVRCWSSLLWLRFVVCSCVVV